MTHDHCNLRYARIDDLAIDCPTTVLSGLSAIEQDDWRQMRSSARRATFLAGRLVAKQLLQQQYPALRAYELTQITIRSNRQGGRSDRPHVEIAGRRLPYSLSITHTDRSVLVGCSDQIGTLVGVDLVHRRDLGSPFERTWLTAAERNLLCQWDDDLSAADLWAMKEAAYKACQQGESFQPRRIEIERDDDRWIVRYRGRDLSAHCTLSTWRTGDEIAALALNDTLRQTFSYSHRKTVA